MARSLRVTWDNRKELRVGPRKTYNGWKRRVRWLCEGDYPSTEANPTRNIRIEFQDEDGVGNRYYGEDVDRAKADWAAFREGTLTVKMVWEVK